MAQSRETATGEGDPRVVVVNPGDVRGEPGGRQLRILASHRQVDRIEAHRQMVGADGVDELEDFV